MMANNFHFLPLRNQVGCSHILCVVCMLAFLVCNSKFGNACEAEGNYCGEIEFSDPLMESR